jgi:hypothetical protein
MQAAHLRSVVYAVGLFCCLECSSEETLSCSDAIVPGLTKCFPGQPAMKTPSCYNATRSMAIPWEYGDGDALSVACRKVDFDTGAPGSFRCKDNQWVQEAAPPSCLAARLSAWRLRNVEFLLHGWWLYEVKFFSDNACQKQIGAQDIIQSFADGPVASGQSPKEALDNDRVSLWKAPCLDSTESDLCGCMTQLKEGYSVDSQKCVPGEITSGYAEEVCVQNGAKKQTTMTHNMGCPKGGVTLGVELRTPQDIGCIGILQHGQKPRNYQQLEHKLSRAAGSLAIDRWNGRGWEEVRQWNNLNTEGKWDTLPLRDRCPEYELPESAPAWVEVLGSGTGHGAKVTIRCADGKPKQVQVECIDGVWSSMPSIVCDIPTLPLPQAPRPTEAPRDATSETGSSMALSIFLLLLMAVALICLLYLARMAAQIYGERRQRLLMHTYAVSERDVEMPATTENRPQRIGRDSREKSARERRSQELGALSSSQFKAKAAALRAQVEECLDGCSPKLPKKDSSYRQARDLTPSKTGTDRTGDRRSSPAQSQRKRGKAPPVPTAPETLPASYEGRRKRTEQRTTPTSSPARRHRSDVETHIDRLGESSPNNLLQHLPAPPPVPPPPSERNPSRQLPAIPAETRNPRNGGMSKQGRDFKLNF